MAYNIATNPDTNVFDGEDYKDLAMSGAGEVGRSTAENMEFIILAILLLMGTVAVLGILFWLYKRQVK